MADAPERHDGPADAKAAGGLEAVVTALGRSVREMGLRRGARALTTLNQARGFDCPGCAWPDPEHRHAFEFCENGAKVVAHEATTRRIGAGFFAEWPIERLLQQSDHWLEQQGRLAEPLWRPAGESHYRAIAWEDAFTRVAQALAALASPDEAVFYTSGRTSNEAAFLYQLFARQFGTNNLPDCSNMCHESSGVGLGESIGVGKGTVGLADFTIADAIFVIGQNPGSNHPRMLTALQAAKRRGCHIVAVNPLRERGLVRFAHPQEPLGLLGHGTEIADLYLQVRVGGDVALLRGIAKAVLEQEAERPGGALDWSFLHGSTRGFEAYRREVESASWETLEARSGVSRERLRAAAEVYTGAQRVIACWAMGITQHRHGVANVQEIVNLLLLRGNIGVPGAGPCPVRGHSNVQGDRTMGITESPQPGFLARLAAEFGFEPPRAHGFDTVAAIEALRDARARFFFALGGNFAVASPDAAQTADALARCDFAAHVATKLNRTHLVAGRESLLLPCLGRTERDVQASGAQFVSVENSMSVVHRSQGHLEPASEQLRSETAIVAGLAEAALGARSKVAWRDLAADYDRIRERIERVVPGFGDFNRRVREPAGFVLPSGARTRHFETADGRAHFHVHPLPEDDLAPGRFLLTTLRSHDQFNTTIYSLDDRYRGISGDRRVVLLHRDDIEAEGLREGGKVDLTSHFRGETRRAPGFRVVAYDLPRRCAAAYFPEANALVPLGSFAEGSRTPSYKSLEISIARAD
ncbi:MAG TPA: FdhF/YdeP family oxidoreductase [Myxococcota bacterium]|nr:FdhF/YdeP family oxidoreductase [Myxococcota bacterium]